MVRDLYKILSCDKVINLLSGVTNHNNRYLIINVDPIIRRFYGFTGDETLYRLVELSRAVACARPSMAPVGFTRNTDMRFTMSKVRERRLRKIVRPEELRESMDARALMDERGTIYSRPSTRYVQQ
jgi:hypothetical protein